MIFRTIRGFTWMLVVSMLAACAQVMAPTGGPKDIQPPKLLEVTPDDSLLNTKVTRIDLRFDEFIVLNNAATEVTVAPILPFPPDVSAIRRTVTVKIPDSLLQPNTTYRISFGNAIQDLHENNPFTGYSYIFSTGEYFDSLSLAGYVMDAASGRKDSGALIVLYDAAKSDSAVVREKPLYARKTDNSGSFRFDGLPHRAFRVYAIRDANNNMIYDGPGEMIAFLDSTVTPSTAPARIRLNIFAEKDSGQQVAPVEESNLSRGRGGVVSTPSTETGFSYIVAADTSNLRKRAVDITRPLEINFTKPVAEFFPERLSLSYDSSGVDVEEPLTRLEDTVKNKISLSANWKENTVYTLRLLKGFARDSAGTEAMPSRYSFRTKQSDDYAKLQVLIPRRFFGRNFVLVILNGKDVVYQQPVLDSVVHLPRLNPGTYRLYVIADPNENGQWDPGNLLLHIQPEEVFAHPDAINLKAGWESMIDFKVENPENDPGLSPVTSDKLRR